MTTIVAIKTPSGVSIGADSKVTDGSGAWWSHPAAKKMREVNGFIVAGSGEVAALDIALHIWQPPAPTNADKKDLYHFVVAKVVPSLKQCFKDNEYKWQPDKDEDDDQKFSFLICVGGDIFEFGDDFGVVMRSSGIYGIGSGSDIALGAIHKGATIEEALQIAADNDIYTAAPFQVLNQEVPTPRKR